MMQYLGGGIGHFKQFTGETPASNIADEVNGDEVEQTRLNGVEVNEHDDTTSDIGHDEEEYVGPQGSEADKDSLEDTFDISATASVDYETDKNIQDTISREFADKTLLCIAHRLKTIIGYDRICVLDAGQIAEFDTPMALYKRTDGIFRSMCERSSITAEDISNASSRKSLD
ncbi:ABC transporter, putative, partial [Rhizoctonia solani AG-3 Rhs1AP]